MDWFKRFKCASVLVSSPSSASCLCLDSAAAECSGVVQVWAVGSGLLPCPPVTAPRHGHGAPNSGAESSGAGQIPPGANGRPPLWACAALPPDSLLSPVSWRTLWGSVSKLLYCMSAAQNRWSTRMKKEAMLEETGSGKEAKETINLLQSVLEPG